jgi:RNA polymerase sigma-70 factor (ECF subfamily)
MTPRKTADTQELLGRLAKGDRNALEELFSRHWKRLERIVSLRLQRRVRRRESVSDVLQKTLLEAWQRLPQYVQKPAVPFFVWLRFLALQRVQMVHREHRARKRDQTLEVPLGRAELTSAEISELLVDRAASPPERAQDIELRERVAAALERLEPLDREILVLRCFEQLTNLEAAEALGITPNAASNRFIRALRRIRGVLAHMPGGLEVLAI